MAKRLIHLFTALNQLGTTVVVATHDVGLITSTPGAHDLHFFADGVG